MVLWCYWKTTTFFLSPGLFSPLCSLNKCSAMNKINTAVSLSAYFFSVLHYTGFFQKKCNSESWLVPSTIKGLLALFLRIWRSASLFYRNSLHLVLCRMSAALQPSCGCPVTPLWHLQMPLEVYGRERHP